jgi:repressor LexA
MTGNVAAIVKKRKRAEPQRVLSNGFSRLQHFFMSVFYECRESTSRARKVIQGSNSFRRKLGLDFAFYSLTMRFMAITKRQRQVYDFISDFVQRQGYSPSFDEIGQGLGLSSLATVHKHISNLEKKGLLTRDYNRSRSIDLLAPKGRLKQAMAVNTTMVLPLLGRIAAGLPIEAVENPETISLADFVRSKEVFVLEVRGDSMQDEHILSGDYVLVEKSKTAHNGDIVVALVDTTDATLKRFYRDGDKIRLQPSNMNMKPIIVPAASVQIQGRVIGVLRKY